MISILNKKSFLIPFLLLLSLLLFLYNRYNISENILYKLTEEKFYYTRELKAFNNLTLVLIGAVSFFLLISIFRNKNIEEKIKFKHNLQFVLSIVFASFLGYAFHIYQAYLVLVNNTSFYEFENSIFKYYISDISIVIGFGIGGLLYLRPIMNIGKADI